jgi:hypothetical protein
MCDERASCDSTALQCFQLSNQLKKCKSELELERKKNIDMKDRLRLIRNLEAGLTDLYVEMQVTFYAF